VNTLKLAWRNLGRNRRRTVITAAALVFGVALSVASYAYFDGMTAEMLRALTRYDLGHAQIHHPEFPETRALKDTVPDHTALDAQARAVNGVVEVSPRLYASAPLSHAGKSLGAELIGVDPATEIRITSLRDQLRDGRYLDADPTPWPRGRELTDEERARDDAVTDSAVDAALAEIEGLEVEAPTQQSEQLTRELAHAMSPPPERPPRVYVGTTLAKILNAGVGDRIHATGQAVDGVTEDVFFEIAGIYETGTAAFDRGRVYLHIADLQRYTHLYDRVHELALVTTKPERAPAIAAALRKTVEKDTVLVRSWDEIRPDVQRFVDIAKAAMVVMLFIIFFVATLGVVNTMLMAVFERTRELGMLKAIGMSGGRIVRMIVTETLLLVLMACAVGTLLGFGIDLYLVHYGIDLSGVTGGFSMGGVGIAPVFRGAITVHGLVMPTVVLSVCCFLASFYPAIRAARMQPAVGMRET
jgi:ABC-type lipoprotein release transport system permease subunit